MNLAFKDNRYFSFVCFFSFVLIKAISICCFFPPEPVKGAEIDRSGPMEIYEGNKLELQCQLRAGNHVLYTWLLNGQRISLSSVDRVPDNRLVINRYVQKPIRQLSNYYFIKRWLLRCCECMKLGQYQGDVKLNSVVW